jgi:hypothetical protein
VLLGTTEVMALPRVRGQVARKLVLPRVGQRAAHCRQDEDRADERGDGAGGVADDGGEADREQRQAGHVERAADDCSQHSRMLQRDAQVVDAEDGLPDEERAEGDDDRGEERQGRDDHGLCGEQVAALGNGAQRRPDGAGAVFPAHRQDRHHAERQLREEQPREADGGRVELELLTHRHLVVGMGVRGADRRAEADAENDRRHQRPVCRPHRAQLGQLRADHVAEEAEVDHESAPGAAR